MAPAVVNGTVIEADDQSVPLALTLGGSPVDITGDSFLYEVRSAPGAPIIISYSTENGGITPNGPTSGGKLWLNFNAADTRGHADLYLHELKCIRAGKRTTVMTGQLTIQGVLSP